MTEQPDTIRATILSPADFDRLLVELDDDPMPPETAAGLAGLRDRPEVFTAPRPAGYTIGVYLPPEASEAVRDALFDQIADATSIAEEGQRWDAHVVGLPGDPLGAVDGQVRP